MVDFKILVIDDDYINRKLLVEILRKKLYKVSIIESVDVEDAIYTVQQESDIQFILINIEMPKMNGLDFLDIYMDIDNKKVPIISISSDDLRKKESLEKGASSFITKPVTEGKLMEAIRNSF
jgi:chemotaxis family two-component system sensor histidine kinase/response regulator PixL